MTCLDCKHLYFDGGEPGYSEHTPAEPMRLLCMYSHWDTSDLDDTDGLRQCFGMAADCTDFEQFDVEAFRRRMQGQ